MTDRIREAVAADAAPIAEVEAAAAAVPWSPRSVGAHLRADVRHGWVVERRGRVVAHLLGMAAADEAELLTVAVHPRRRREGLGRRLVRHAQRRWAQAGVEAAYLEVREDNAAARALYATLGWAPTGRRRSYYRDGCDAVLYRWSAPCS